ncbi:hypothetical protein BU26DRAFT_250055 [Trematosphaeria pertusa]|uniref:Uncharacterized protein n=1 Tax=Trematosphaeria pertusa TaxID=390896 RepID=A0A6A6IRB4_9PLEO|nr:uncharacterized protein BU26DRAFT_250055 [Trematosphaeria pertusa]KAF2252063.1 hypothetical protein BU26DRAFT_250055 [Trematosphaeria pertusa]
MHVAARPGAYPDFDGFYYCPNDPVVRFTGKFCLCSIHNALFFLRSSFQPYLGKIQSCSFGAELFLTRHFYRLDTGRSTRSTTDMLQLSSHDFSSSEARVTVLSIPRPKPRRRGATHTTRIEPCRPRVSRVACVTNTRLPKETVVPRCRIFGTGRS